MSDNVDPSDVKKACFADLTRNTEVLPTLLRETIPLEILLPDVKKNLKSKWSVTIFDEESEQIQGLSNEDARPWAKKVAQAYMSKNPTSSAPPRVGPSPFAAKKTNFIGTHTPSGTAGKLGGLVPPGGAATLRSTPKDSAKCGAAMSCTTASQKTATPQPSLAGQSLDKKDALPELHRTPGGTALHFSVNPITDPGSADHTLCHGKCAVKLPQAAEDITANFVLKIEKPTNRALLVLSAPGKPQRVHNIVDLKQPVIQNNYCLVASVPGRANVAYLLRLQTPELTAKFKLYLESLQVTMKRQQKSTLPLPKRTGDGTATGSGVRNNGEASSQSSRSAMPSHGPSTPVSTAPLTTVASQGPSGSSAAPMLVDLDDSDESRDPANPYATIEDAADKLCTLMDSLERDFVDKGFPLTGDAVDELQDTAIDIWLQRGFLGAEDADIKEDMIKLLKSLFQVKRQAMQFRHKFKTSRLHEVEFSTPPSKFRS
ncbi:hypothetical protein ACCO45_000325 [Purpureocillium lilacinum]|uniref:Uncharacterized protein n=1 Tax=Purpureocillium lilacinum TaxID=33203 RepID=A0ACC4E4D7_PURLI